MGTKKLLRTYEAYDHVDIGAARALPIAAYTSEALFDLEKRQIFRREWLCVGRLEQVPTRGDYFTVEVLGEPIIIVRGNDGVLRALSAVCRHRYFSVAEASGNASRFTCPYHRWVYELDGRLRGAPHMGEVTDAQGRPCRLPEFPLETWLGFIFVCLAADVPPLAPRLAGAEVLWRNYDVASWRVLPWVDEVWPGNWKLAMETALEGYHVTSLHEGTIARFMPSASSTFAAMAEQWTMFRMDTVFEGEFAEYRAFADAMTGKDRTSAPQFGFFPNCAVSCSQSGGIWLTFLPLDVGRTRVIGGNLVHPSLYERIIESEVRHDGYARAVDAINAQDASAMVNLQRNAHSAHAEPGLLSEKERCLLYFYRYLGNRLRADGDPAQQRILAREGAAHG